MSSEQLQAVRGRRISVVFQDPLTSLHPLYKVGWQIAEMIRAHDKTVGQAAATERAVELLGHGRHPPPATSGSTTTRTSSPAACASAP